MVPRKFEGNKAHTITTTITIKFHRNINTLVRRLCVFRRVSSSFFLHFFSQCVLFYNENLCFLSFASLSVGFCIVSFMFGNNFIALDFWLVLCWIFPLNSLLFPPFGFFICACMRNSSYDTQSFQWIEHVQPLMVVAASQSHQSNTTTFINKRPPIIIIAQLEPYFIVCILCTVQRCDFYHCFSLHLFIDLKFGRFSPHFLHLMCKNYAFWLSSSAEQIKTKKKQQHWTINDLLLASSRKWNKFRGNA